MKTTYPGQDSVTRLIGAFSQPGRHRTPMLLGRQRRSDSIIGSLPPEQRGKVDKWLFDKGLTYAQVAEGCQKFFGVKVSKSSVARYCDRELREQMARKRLQQRAKERASVSDLHAKLTPDEGFQLLIQRVMRLANEAAERVQFSQRYEGFLDRREFRWFLRLMRLLIAARREKNMGIRVQAERAKMQIETAKACLNLRRCKTQKDVIRASGNGGASSFPGNDPTFIEKLKANQSSTCSNGAFGGHRQRRANMKCAPYGPSRRNSGKPLTPSGALPKFSLISRANVRATKFLPVS